MNKLIKNIILSINIFSYLGLSAYANNINVDNLVDLFNSGNPEVIETVVDFIDQNGMEETRLEFLKLLSSQELALFLEELFRPQGGEVIKHWAYNPLKSTNELKDNTYYHKNHDLDNGFENDYFYITKSARASQYIIFFLESPYVLSPEYNEKTERAKKLAEALNLMDINCATEMLYGRFDARFLGDRDKLVLEDTSYKIKRQLLNTRLLKFFGAQDKDNNDNNFLSEGSPSLKDPHNRTWNYETYITDTDGSKKYYPQLTSTFYANTVEARVPLKVLRLLVPYLKDELIQKIREEEDLMSFKGLRQEL